MDLLKILIVDDEWLIRSELREMLSQHPGIQVVGEAGGVDEAVQIIQKTDPNIIFLDIQMPGRSGFDLLKQIDKDCKIVFVSAFNQYMEEANKYKPVDYLLKPISRSQLDRVVKKLRPFRQNGRLPCGGKANLEAHERE